MALNQGNTGRAIAELAEAERNCVSTAVVKPRLVDLYCNTGQPEKAYELLATGALEDPNLGAEPGSGAFRQGRVYFLLGNYLSAATLWHERAIPRVRADRSGRVLAAATGLTRGDAMQTTNLSGHCPRSLRQQATWLYDLGMCQLEAGMPDRCGREPHQGADARAGPRRPADRGLLSREDGKTGSAATRRSPSRRNPDAAADHRAPILTVPTIGLAGTSRDRVGTNQPRNRPSPRRLYPSNRRRRHDPSRAKDKPTASRLQRHGAVCGPILPDGNRAGLVRDRTEPAIDRGDAESVLLPGPYDCESVAHDRGRGGRELRGSSARPLTAHRRRLVDQDHVVDLADDVLKVVVRRVFPADQ